LKTQTAICLSGLNTDALPRQARDQHQDNFGNETHALRGFAGKGRLPGTALYAVSAEGEDLGVCVTGAAF